MPIKGPAPNAPNADFGVWVQNAHALLIEGGEFYLDSAAGVVYYMPLAGQDMTTVQSYLGILEALVVIGGSYDAPAHNIAFTGFDYVRPAHNPWPFYLPFFSPKRLTRLSLV